MEIDTSTAAAILERLDRLDDEDARDAARLIRAITAERDAMRAEIMYLEAAQRDARRELWTIVRELEAQVAALLADRAREAMKP